MVGNVGNILNSVQQRQLTVLQQTTRKLDGVQVRLATGKEVNSALDGPTNFFVARSLDDRASDLQRLLDGINKSIKTIQYVQHSIEAIQQVLNTADSFLTEYRQDLITGNVEVQEVLETEFFLDFDDNANFINYGGGQDSGVPVTIIEDGHGVIFDDNAWRRFPVNYNVTANTIIEFDFRSTNIPEIAAISFDDDNTFNNDPFHFFLYGTQLGGVPYAAPTPTFEYDGSGDWVHVTIPVGTFYTGNFPHIGIIADDDGPGDDGDAQFRNMVIHDGEYVYGATSLTVSDTYEEQYSTILDQVDLLVQDSHYRGINLLEGDDMTTYFNEHRTSSLTTEGMFASSDGLGLERLDFTTVEAVDAKIEQVREAREILRYYATSLAVDFSILNDRDSFTRSMINVLEAGRDDLTLTDQNRDGAELLALQTRQTIQTSVLTLNTASIADFLL